MNNKFINNVILTMRMFKSFTIKGAAIMLKYAVLRRLSGIKDNKKTIVSIYAKRVKRHIYIRPFTTDYTLLLNFFTKKGGHYNFEEITPPIGCILDGG